MEYPSVVRNSLLSQTNRSTLYSRNIKWFLDSYVLKTKKVKEITRSGILKLEAGKIYTFQYDPITADKLAFYDNMPINLILGHIKTEERENAYGINLSFLPPRMRVMILDKFVYANMKAIDSNRKIISNSSTLFNHAPTKPLKFDYEMIKKLLVGSGFEFAIRSYIYNQMKSKPMVITYDDWYRLPMFPSQFIEKLNVMAIYGRHQRTKSPNFKFTPSSVAESLKWSK